MTRAAKVPALVAAALAALLLLSGCSAASGGSSNSAGSNNDAAVGADEASDVAEPGDAAVIVRGEMWFTSDDPLAAARSATEIVLAADGRVDAREEETATDGDAARATLTVRIPSAKVEQVTAQLADVAPVGRSTLNTEEVGTQQRDLDARAASLRASIARYNEWLAKATKPADLMELEAGLAERQTELESLEAEITRLADQVAMSTFTLIFSEIAPTVTTEPRNFGEAVTAGWSDFTHALGGFTIVLGRMLPWLVSLALIAGVAWWVMRRRRS